MNDDKRDQIKALKDPYFRRAEGIGDASHPAGAVELDDAELASVSGAATPTVTVPITVASIRFCRYAATAVLTSAQTGWDPLESTCRHASLSIL